MDTNDCIKQIHAALVAKAKDKCAVGGNNKLALEISGKVAEYGSAWAASFGNDGKLDDDEERALNAKFNALVDTYLPKKDGILVEKAWNGFSILFVNVFKGVKNYLNEWFKLGLACLAVAALTGCAYKGGKVVDGTNLAIGITVPGTEWSINVIDYVGGLRVAGNDMTSIVVSNEVAETNSYFGIVETRRHTTMTATIEPCESAGDDN